MADPLTSYESWQVDVATKLATVIAELQGVREQVTRQNGNVAKLWSEMDRVREHPTSCPLHERMSHMEAEMVREKSAGEVRDRESDKWEQRLKPVVWLVFMFLVGLILGHGDMLRGIGVPK